MPLPRKTPYFVPAWPAHGSAPATGTKTEQRPDVPQPSYGQTSPPSSDSSYSVSHVYIFADQYIVGEAFPKEEAKTDEFHTLSNVKAVLPNRLIGCTAKTSLSVSVDQPTVHRLEWS